MPKKQRYLKHSLQGICQKLRVVLITALLFMCFNCLAAVKEIKEPSLYEALLPVTNLSKEEQATLIREAFKTVLVQVTGSEKTLNNPSIQKAIGSVDDYVNQFSIQEDANHQRFIRVKFERAAVNELLQRSKMPILAQKRPSTTVWMVMSQDPNNPQWLGEDSDPELFQQIHAFSKQRRVPLVFPLLDLSDSALVSEQSIMNDDFTAIQNASQRYTPEKIWIGKIIKQPSGYLGQWTLLSRGKSENWENTHAELATLCKDAMDELSSRLVNTSQLAKGTPTTDTKNNTSKAVAKNSINTINAKNTKLSSKLQLSVSGINGIEDYAKVLEYLKTLPSVKDVDVIAVNPNQTIFEVSTGGRDSLTQNIAKGHVLTEGTSADSEDSTTEPSGILKYKIAEVL